MLLSSRTPRSRIKLKPSLAVCSLPCLLAVSLILLLAQLRALELTSPNVIRIPAEFIAENKHQNQLTESTATDSTNGFERRSPLEDAAKSLVNSSHQNVTTTTTREFEFELEAPNQTQEFAAAGSGAAPSHEADSRGQQLNLQQAAAELVASFNGQPQTLPNGQLVGQPERSLVEMAAAGTVAGLRVAQDLMAQANSIGEQPNPHAAFGRQQQDTNIWPGADENIGATMAANGANDDNEQDDAEALPGDGEMESGGGRANLPEARSDAELLEQARNRMVLANGNNGGGGNGGNGLQQADEAGPERPMDESQMPDSIESLMGADLEANLDEPEDGQSQAGDQSNLDEAADQQQPAGSNTLYANNPNSALGLSHQQLGPAWDRLQQGDSEDDEDDEAANDGQQQQQAIPMRRMDAAEMNAPAIFRPAPLVLAGNGLGVEGQAIGAPQTDHTNLVAPMRDSLEDLNAAAGHYYGKKKKKKVIVKKKKKKKKIKIKKYKVVKIKKKKKKKYKKHYPKKHYHHKKHHGHDHGKYYMYAKVPKKKAWEFGFKKGNKKHWISRHEKGYKNKFKTKVKWFDKKSKGKGIHVWDYNHHDKKKKKHHY